MAEQNKNKTNPPYRQGPHHHRVAAAPWIDHGLWLKWGLALLGEARAKEYLAWLAARRKLAP